MSDIWGPIVFFFCSCRAFPADGKEKRYGLTHGNVPFHDARDGQDRFQPLERREQGSFGGQAQYADTTGSSIQPGWGKYPPPNQPAIPGIDGALVEHGQIIGHAYAGPVPPPKISRLNAPSVEAFWASPAQSRGGSCCAPVAILSLPVHTKARFLRTIETCPG